MIYITKKFLLIIKFWSNNFFRSTRRVFRKVTITKINRKDVDYENSELTSCLGFMLYRILSALFSESFRDSMIASRSLEALFFSSRTRSIRVLPRGFMSFKISAVIISRPLLSCVAIQFWFSWHGPG